MSKATCVTDQIGFLWQITHKHRVSNLAQKQGFATAEKLHGSWMGFGNQPSHPTRSTFTSNHFIALPLYFPGKLSAEIKRWGYPHGSKVLKFLTDRFLKQYQWQTLGMGFLLQPITSVLWWEKTVAESGPLQWPARKTSKWGLFRGLVNIFLDFLVEDQRREAISTFSSRPNPLISSLQPIGVQPLELLAGSARHEDCSTSTTSHVSSSALVWGPYTATPKISTGVVNFCVSIQSLEFIFLGMSEVVSKYFKYSPKKTSI